MTPKTIAEAAKVLARGGTVVYPTETVYGIGASIYIPEAVERIFEIKGRAHNLPLSVAVASFEMIERIARIDEDDLALLRKVLPGPVTILVEKSPDLPDTVTAGSRLVGIRFPDHPMALELIRTAGPITSTSANLSGQKPPSSLDELDPKIAEKVDLVLDGGRSRFAQPSTLVELATRRVMREGAGMEMVRELLG
ncbi:MAG TPA: L-threonylcarbamoyladenylate synthase [Methanothrix sp.]|nr:L-threonylcarbamoyladenylate synthase [Methanothrix sp.]HPJ83628.1 L-threonylcarbamoyladenylate synthase [Methanothrix sp.]HPR67497.1 L-threonylcarbamoyladenylate synthase [Methanothrix sp.]